MVLWRLLLLVLIFAMPAQGIVVPHSHAPRGDVEGSAADHDCKPHFHLGGAFGHSHHGQKVHRHAKSHAKTGSSCPGSSEQCQPSGREGANDPQGENSSCPCGESAVYVGDPLAPPMSTDVRLDVPQESWVPTHGRCGFATASSVTPVESFLRPPDDGTSVPIYLSNRALRL